MFVKDPSLSAGRREIGCGDHPNYHSAVKAILIKRQQHISRQMGNTPDGANAKAAPRERVRKPKAAAALHFAKSVRLPLVSDTVNTDVEEMASPRMMQTSTTAPPMASSSTMSAASKPARFEDVGELTAGESTNSDKVRVVRSDEFDT